MQNFKNAEISKGRKVHKAENRCMWTINFSAIFIHVCNNWAVWVKKDLCSLILKGRNKIRPFKPFGSLNFYKFKIFAEFCDFGLPCRALLFDFFVHHAYWNSEFSFIRPYKTFSYKFSLFDLFITALIILRPFTIMPNVTDLAIPRGLPPKTKF